MEASFVSDRNQLKKVLELLGVTGVDEILKTISNFFLKKIGKRNLNLSDLQNLNLKKLIYDFLAETGFEKPTFNNPEEKQMVIGVFYKLGRLYIHDILIPELSEINPRLAYSTLQLLKRTASSISAAQGINKKIIFDNLLLDQIEIPLTDALLPAVKSNNTTYQNIKVKYLKPNDIQLVDLDKIAECLLKEHGAIYKKSAFISLINSDGTDISPMKIPTDKVKLIAHLFFRMYKPYNDNHSKLIVMSKGKGYWDFLQENIINETENTFTWPLKKYSSDVMRKQGHDQIRSDIEKILKPYYAKYNSSK